MLLESRIFVLSLSSRYALVDFGLAQGTADTQIELLKVVRQRSAQKGGGSTGKQDITQRGKASHRAALKTTTASTSAPPPQQSTAMPPPSSSSSSSSNNNNTISSSTASQKALVKRARSVTATTTTTTTACRTKHSKVSVWSQYCHFPAVFFSVWWQSSGNMCWLSLIWITQTQCSFFYFFASTRNWWSCAKCTDLCLGRGTWTAALHLHPPLPNRLPLGQRWAHVSPANAADMPTNQQHFSYVRNYCLK